MTPLTPRRVLECYPERQSVALELEAGENLCVRIITQGAMEYAQRLFVIVDQFEDDGGFFLRARTHVVVVVSRLSRDTLTANLLCAAYYYQKWLPEAVHQARRETNRDPRTLPLSTP